MDHLALQCKKKLETFRIKELKDVLSRIGAGKQGKKQVLVDKIMAIYLSAERGPSTGLKLENLTVRSSRSREDVARIVDEVYRMRRFSAPDLATSMVENGARDSSLYFTQQNLHNGMQFAMDSKTRCPCGTTMEFGSMIQCDVPSCLARQHVNCVILPEKEDTKPEIPTKFFCELCRIQHGDPFCVSVAHPLMPIKTLASMVYSSEGGASVIQNLEASFIITENDRDLLQYPEYDLQIWCVLLGDEVPYRMHWPLKADLRVNGDFVRVTNRPGQQKLGANGRDDGPVITSHTREGINRILFTAFDGRSFCLGVRIVRRLTIDQVLSQVPGEGEGESFGVALERVCRCISGGGAVGDDSDSELEVVSEWVTVNLRCPMSGSRIKVAGRFKPCMHMGCFDLHTFVQLNERARKWQCPICLKNYSLKDLVIDPFFTQITRALESYDEDVSEVEMKPDGFWRPKLDGDAQFNESWRSPGCLNNMVTDVNTMATDVDDFNLGFNIAEVSFESTQDGLWKAKGTLGPEDLTVSDMILGHSCEVIKNMARSHKSTASVSREVSSVNQEPKKVYRYYGREEVEVNSCPFIAHVTDYPSAFFGNVCDQGVTTEVILLSDEEDNSTAFNTGAEGPGAGYVNCVEVHEDERGYYDHYSQGGFLHNYPEAGIAQPEVGFCQSNMTVAVDFLGMGQEPSAISAYKGMCQTENDVGSYDFLRSAPESFMDQSSHLIDSSPAMQAYNSSVFLNQFPKVTSVLVDTTGISPCEETPVTCAPEYETLCKESSQELAASDPSFREFLPHQPARSAANLPGHERREALTDDMQVGWFSLSLGGSESVNATVPLHEPSAQKTQIDPLVESASLLLDLSHGKPRVDGSFFGSNRTKGAFSSKHLKVSCSLSVFSNEIPL